METEPTAAPGFVEAGEAASKEGFTNYGTIVCDHRTGTTRVTCFKEGRTYFLVLSRDGSIVVTPA